MYLSVCLSIYLSICTGKPEKKVRCVWTHKKHPLDWTWCKGAGTLCGYVVSLAGIPTKTQSKFTDLNSCHFRFPMDFASYGLPWRRSALYVGPCLHSIAHPRFGALSPTNLRARPLKLCLFATSPHTPLTHFVRSKSSSLAYRLAFVNASHLSPSSKPAAAGAPSHATPIWRVRFMGSWTLPEFCHLQQHQCINLSKEV